MIKFEGWYYKHQNPNDTLAFIPGRSQNNAFIQIISNTDTYYALYNRSEFSKKEYIKVGQSKFYKNKIIINIDKKDLKVNGEIKYYNLTKPKYDIMGFFKYLPMECKHSITSLHHNLIGEININDKIYNFDNGIGYIEGDNGSSFPKNYIWIQSNYFKKKCCIMISVADIPFMGLEFRGIIASVWYQGAEYRLATYNGARILEFNNEKVKISCGRYRLEAYVLNENNKVLYAPSNGNMKRKINESVHAKVRFRFYISGRLVFDIVSDRCGLEWEKNIIL